MKAAAFLIFLFCTIQAFAQIEVGFENEPGIVLALEIKSLPEIHVDSVEPTKTQQETVPGLAEPFDSFSDELTSAFFSRFFHVVRKMNAFHSMMQSLFDPSPLSIPSFPLLLGDGCGHRHYNHHNLEECRAELTKFCSDAEDRVHALLCLHKKEEFLTEKCLQSLKDRISYHCASDAVSLCPGVSNRFELRSCIRSNVAYVSNECKQAIFNKHPEVNKPQTVSPHPTQKPTVPPRPETDQPKPETPASAALPASPLQQRVIPDDLPAPSSLRPVMLFLSVAFASLVAVISLALGVAFYLKRRRVIAQPSLHVPILSDVPSVETVSYPVVAAI